MGSKSTFFLFLLLLSLASVSQQPSASKKNAVPSKAYKPSNSSGSTLKTSKPTSKPHPSNASKNINSSTANTTSKTKQSNASSNNALVESDSKKNELTGIWRGYFAQQSFGFFEDKYRFEVQVEQLGNNALNGVTYSYKTTVFYGKANFKGIYTPKTNNILLNELDMVELKIDPQSQPCLMTCYLEYSKMGSLEVLSGTYTSRNMKDRGDCGSGKVYLEKTTTTDFYKEDFLVKRENDQKAKAKNNNKTSNDKKLSSTGLINIAKVKIVKPGAEENLLKNDNRAIAKFVKDSAVVVQNNKAPEANVKKLTKPGVIKSRDNELVKTITISEKSFKIDLYDNGEIDGDRISVYDNNQLIVSNKMLTDKPISFTINCDEKNPVHEFVMVAENLGSIPPNTSLMIITAGEKRYELFVTSTEQKNAVVKVEYKAE